VTGAIRSAADRVLRAAMNRTARTGPWDVLRLAIGQQAVSAIGRVDHLDTLADAECRVFSQWGEDGIIEWLVRRLPGIPETFVEFGVEDYVEANTRFLLHHRNWRGLVIDGSAGHVASINGRDDRWRHDLTAVHAFVTVDNINRLISSVGFRGEIGMLSVDIDGNDYWVLDAIDVVHPWIVVVEYNAVLGDLQPVTIPYDPDFVRSPERGEQLYYGAAIGAFDHWAARHGYLGVGSNLAGSNAFFVREDCAGSVLPHVTSTAARPSRFREARRAGGELTMANGIERLRALRGLPLVDVRTATRTTLDSPAAAYSDAWQRALVEGTPLPTRHP
jgi:hypothetical protein